MSSKEIYDFKVGDWVEYLGETSWCFIKGSLYKIQEINESGWLKVNGITDHSRRWRRHMLIELKPGQIWANKVATYTILEIKNDKVKYGWLNYQENTAWIDLSTYTIIFNESYTLQNPETFMKKYTIKTTPNHYLKVQEGGSNSFKFVWTDPKYLQALEEGVTQFTKEEADALVLLMKNKWFGHTNAKIEEVQEAKTCDGKIVKMKDDDGVEREYKLTLVTK